MNNVQPAVRRRYCVCGRLCGDPTPTPSSARDRADKGASNEPSSRVTSGLQPEKSAPAHPTSGHLFRPTPPPAPVHPTATPPSDTLSLLQLKVRALEKYKTNYELLCSQLAELNTQVGLQLQRHEVDVTTLHTTITTLQTTNATLQQELENANQQLHTLQTTSEKDREYAGGVHKQLTTVAELLKGAEKRQKEQDAEHQREIVRHKATQQEVVRHQSETETLQAELGLLREQLTKAAESEKQRRKYRTELKQRTLELEQLRDELEQQRAATRHTKKQLKHTRDDRDTLAKQLEHIKSDGTQLTAILEAQRDEMARHDKKAQRWKQLYQDGEARLHEVQQNLEDVEAQLTRVQEELVAKNAKVEQLLMETKEWKQRHEVAHSETKSAKIEMGHLQAQLERVTHEFESYKTQQTEWLGKKDEANAKDLQRRYHQDLEQMKQLLSLNQQRTTESSHDMQVLKKELGSVQLLLRQCHRQKRATRRRDPVESTSESGDERAWRLRHQQAQVEKTVLQSAIMEQVNEAW